MFVEMFQILLAAVALVLAAIVICLDRFAQKAYTGGSDAKYQPDQVSIVDIAPPHAARLREITSQEKTMVNVGGGRVWNAARVERFIKYNAEEQKTGDGERVNYYWAIVCGEVVVGVVGFHPVTYGKPGTDNLTFVTIFVDAEYQGRGVGGKALRKAIARFKEVKELPVYADVRVDNTASLGLLKKVGFTETGHHKIHKKQHVRLQLTSRRCPARTKDPAPEL